jgi:phenylalanyl-tRNA synthetase beta chain
VFTDARSRFERGVDTSLVLPALDAAAQMIQELCGGTISPRSMAGSVPAAATVVAFDAQRVQTLGGVSLTTTDADRILTTLGFAKAADGWQIPAWRHDIDGEADLVEEILRVRGYDALPVTPLPLKAPVVGTSSADKVRRLMAGLGMTEAVTWSFTDSTLAALFGGHADTARVANPISSDLDVLRPGLLPNLLLAARRNLDNNVQGNSLFEVGAVFQGGTPGQQQLTASGIFWGNVSAPHWHQPARTVDAFDAKGMMQRVLSLFGLAADTMPIQADSPDWYHPGQSGTLALGSSKVLATFGMLHPALLQKMGIEVPVAAFEVHLEALPVSKTKNKQPLTLSPYQPVERDFAFVVPDTLPFATLQKAITTADRTLISETRLFDIYTGKGIPDGHKSLALTVRLEPASTTLDDAGLQAVQQKIIAAAEKVGAVLR